ncbi:MAG TPA: hypothetical protein VN132_01955, partial [Bdellovibrio sp.]|nr:hypothetical protein [Bdellovibrio sp.]
AKVSGNQINASNLQASFSSDGQLESLTVPFDLMAFEAESKAIDQTKTVEIVEDPVGHVKLSPSVLLFSNGQAWQFKIINRTVYNILLTGPITSTFLKPATSSMVDQVVLSTAGPGIIKVELPWSEKLYLELRSKN